MFGSFVPDVIRYGIGAVGQTCGGFGEGQGGAFSLGEEGGIATVADKRDPTISTGWLEFLINGIRSTGVCG